MSREKQIIEDMAKISCNTSNSEIKWECAECPFNTVCDIQISCEALYNAGYRKQEWISVEERLPEDDGFVLLCTSKGSIIKGHYEHKYGRWSGLNNRLNVTHWMALPEAPKGGAE